MANPLSRVISRIRGGSPEPERRNAANGAFAGRVGYGGSVTQGGIMNPVTGLGTEIDKTESSFLIPTRFWWRSPLEVLYVQSWAARNFIEIPVDDMFIRWREWSDGEVSGAADVMEAAETRHLITHRLRQAMHAARAYGTSLMILMTQEAPLEEPLIRERIREGDLKAIRVFDRYDASVAVRDRDVFSQNYGRPEVYNIHPTNGSSVPFRVHHSRVIRFDGIKPATDSGFYNYDQEEWSLSALTPVILSILQDQSLASAVAHMSQEASIPVLNVTDLRELVAGRSSRHEPSIDEIGSAINRVKSVWRLLMLDKERETFERVSINFGGLADLMDRFYGRLAAAAQIPQTRFLGRSPAGMNSTGDGDMRNYVMSVEAKRASLLETVLPLLDDMLARDSGLSAVPDYEFQSLLEMSDREKAEAAKIKAEALAVALTNNAIDEDEFRRSLDGDPIFGDLPGDAPEADDLPDIDVTPDGMDDAEPQIQ